MKYAIMTAIAAASLTATASWANTPDEVPNSVRLFNINGYSVIDNEHVLLRGGGRRHYLVTLQNECRGLNFGIRMTTSFSARTTIHHPTMEYISGASFGRCYIDTIEEVDDADTARALIENRAEAAEAAENS